VTLLPRTLDGRLTGLMLVLIIVINIFYVVLALRTTRIYLQEVDQTLNLNVAANIVNDGWLSHGDVDQAINRISAVNPRIELYVLDPSGNILNSSGLVETVERKSVSLAPIAAFLDQSQKPPILGDDPRDSMRQKIFSVAPVHNGGALAGYLYVVVGGRRYDSVISMLQNSYALRLGLRTMVGGLLVVIAAGLGSFYFLTRRLRRLASQVASFRCGDDRQASADALAKCGSSGDEIDQIAETFATMLRRIDHQMGQLTLADQSRRDFLASVSHDLRTPLSALQGCIETILMKIDNLTKEQTTKYLTLAFKNGERLRDLVDDLFEFSTLDTGDWPLRAEVFSLSDLVQDVCQKFELRAREAGIQLTLNILNRVGLVEGDIGLVERLIDNLIDNAIKFTPPPGSVCVRLISARDQLIVEVRDTGIGIAETDLPHIFEPFYSINHGGETRHGAGLGLAIASRIAGLHHSKIEIESTPGGGTLFRFGLAKLASGGGLRDNGRHCGRVAAAIVVGHHAVEQQARHEGG
jgi:signal transduction histidine kinase